jgi:integrase
MGYPDPVTGAIGAPVWSPTFPTKKAADDHQRAARTAIIEGKFSPDRGMTVTDWMDKWLARKATQGRSPLTLTGYRQISETWIKPHLGKHRLSDLSPHHIQSWLDRIARQPSHKPGPSGTPPTPGTLVNIRACLRAALSEAERQELVSRNAARLVTLPEVTRATRQALTREQLAAFRAVVEADELSGLWHVAMFCGPRRGELAGMTLAGTDEAAGLITVEQQVASPTGLHRCPVCGQPHRGRLIKRVKSQAGNRIFPLPSPLVGILLAHRLRLGQVREAWGSEWSEHGLLFPSVGADTSVVPGGPLRPGYLGYRFGRLLAEAGIAEPGTGGPSLHALRTSFLTLLAQTGVSPDLTAPLAGHSDGEVTRRHYIRQSAEAARDAFETVAAEVFGMHSSGGSDQPPDQRSNRARKP